MKTFATTFRDGDATTDQFILTALQVSRNKAVVPLPRDWLYKKPVPPLQGYTAPAASALARRSAPAKPDLVGLRCGRGSHAGSPATCGEAAAN